MKNLKIIKETALRYWKELAEWFMATGYFNEDSFITRLRYFQISSFSILFIASFFNFINNSVSGYIITASTCLCLIIARFLIDCNREKQAYKLMLMSVNGGLILLTISEGLRSGEFLFFLPVIITFSFLADVNNRKDVSMTYLASIGSFIIAVLLAPDSPAIHKLAREVNNEKFFFNAALSTMMVAWMSFALARENSRKQAILKDKQVFLDTIFNSSMHTEIIVDAATGCITSCNDHAIMLFTKDGSGSLTGSPARNLFLELTQPENETFLQQIFTPENNWKGELTCVRVDGSRFPCSTSFISFKYHDKHYKKITVVDITEKNNMLSELKSAKKNAEESAKVKSQFLSHMSHELRTPLNGIIGATNLLLQERTLVAQKEKLNILKFSSEHMMNLINDILDLSKLDADRIQLEKTEVNIPDYIRKISLPFISQYDEKGVMLKIITDPLLKRSLLADPTRLNQVLTNLLSNAFKFTESGTVTLQAKGISLRSDYNTIEFSVTDTGIGISEDKQEKIFEQFRQADVKTTRKYGGTGLGLSISQKMVKLMGGELKVESRVNEGSRFYFQITLPVHNDQPKTLSAESAPIPEESLLENFKVLVAEDNPINMMIVTKFLDKWGVGYEKARNGAEAVSLFSRNRFNMVLMDLDMPEMDGYEALSEIRKQNKDIPAIAFTAAVFDNMKEELEQSGFNDYLQKPFRPEDLQARLIKFSRKEQLKRA